MWQVLMETFHLEDEVEAIIRARVIELVADGQHGFAFRGTGGMCSMDVPHPPHVVEYYQTARYGCLEKYCLGREGELPDGHGTVHIVITERHAGAPEYPGKARGYWFVAEPTNLEEVRE